MDDSKKLTVTGIVGGLGLILTQIYYGIDNDPDTMLDFTKIVAGLTLMGLGWFATGKEKKS